MDTRFAALAAELVDAQRDGNALNEIISALYVELCRLAHRQLRWENAAVGLNTTSLVHEAYLRLAGSKQLRIQDRSHLLALASQLMRRILVDDARRRRRRKRGGGETPSPFHDALVVARERSDELLRLDDCLGELSRIDPRKARVVEMRFFGGLSVEETASALSVSCDTVVRDWKLSKVWLMREMKKRAGDGT